MKFLTPLLLAFGLLFAQVQPLPAAMRIPAGRMPCGETRHPCQEHEASGKSPACALCFSCGLGWHLAVLTGPILPAAMQTPVARMVFQNEVGLQRRDPPPLPPPRGPLVRESFNQSKNIIQNPS